MNDDCFVEAGVSACSCSCSRSEQTELQAYRARPAECLKALLLFKASSSIYPSLELRDFSDGIVDHCAHAKYDKDQLRAMPLVPHQGAMCHSTIPKKEQGMLHVLPTWLLQSVAWRICSLTSVVQSLTVALL